MTIEIHKDQISVSGSGAMHLTQYCLKLSVLSNHDLLSEGGELCEVSQVYFVGLATTLHPGLPLCLRAPINICLVSLCPTPNRIFTPEDEDRREWERD